MTELVDLSVPGRRLVEEWWGKTPDEPFPPRVRLRILLRYDRKCADCGRTIRPGKPWTADHKIAIINGGENRERNGQPLCEFCVKPKDAADQAQKSHDADVMKAAYGLKPKSKLSKEYRREVMRRYVRTGEASEICGWPLAESADKGCVPGDCSYRPDDSSGEWSRIKARRAALASRPQEQPRKATGEIEELAAELNASAIGYGVASEDTDRAPTLAQYRKNLRDHADQLADAAARMRRASVSSAAPEGWQKPVAWLHEVKEPNRDWEYMLSKQAEHPWSHWIEKHKAECEFRSTPLYAAPPSPAAQEQEK